MAFFTALAVGAALGLSALGTFEQYSGAKKSATANAAIAQQNQQIAQEEQQADAVRRQAMEVDARRRSLETVRNAQRANATSLTNATSQGAQYGSGLQGGYGQISGQANTSLQGIQQQLDFGNQLFDINSGINQNKYNIFGYGGQVAQGASQSAMGAGLSSLGGTLLTNANTINSIGTSAFGGSKIGIFNNGGGSAPTWTS